MRTLLLLTLSLSALLSGHAQKPEHCKFPPYLEGAVAVMSPEKQMMFYELFYYDAVGQRIHVIASGKEGDHSLSGDRIMLFKEKVYYEIYYQNQTCVKMPLSAAFIPMEIPPDAQHQAQFVLGTLTVPGQGVLLNDWVGSIPEDKANYLMTITDSGCIPITFVYQTEKMGKITLRGTNNFTNIVVGVEFPGIFVPPSFCGSAKLEEPRDGKVANFFTALL